MYRKASALLVTLLIASHAALGKPPPDGLIHEGEGLPDWPRAIILVRVVEASSRPTFPPEFNSRDRYAPITGGVLVLKSWKGPFSTGQVLHVGSIGGCAGPPDCCANYPLKAGDELLIFTPINQEPILARPCDTWPAAESTDLMAGLDRAVIEDRMLKDPQTDIARAPERYRIMQALKECFMDGDPNAPDGYTSCNRNMNVSALIGIKRSELAAYWGPPRCQNSTSPGGSPPLPPTGTNCPAEDAVWVFGNPIGPRQGLWCSSEETGRCMHYTWISVEDSTPQHQ